MHIEVEVDVLRCESAVRIVLHPINDSKDHPNVILMLHELLLFLFSSGTQKQRRPFAYFSSTPEVNYA